MQDTNRQASLTFRKSILAKVVLDSALLTIFVVLVLLVSVFLVARGILMQRVFAQLSSVVTASEDAIYEMLNSGREQAAVLALHPEVRRALVEGSSSSFGELFSLLQRESPGLMGMHVFADDGRLVARAGISVVFPGVRGATTVSPILSRKGWEAYDIHTPLRYPNGEIRGMLSVRYGIVPVLANLLRVISPLGKTASLFLTRESQGELFTLHQGVSARETYMIMLGNISDLYLRHLPLARAALGEEGVEEAYDDAGKHVLTAYRFLPSLGFGVVVQVEKAEALEGVVLLALRLMWIGILLLVFTGSVAFLLGQQLTHPLVLLTAKVVRLRPGSWGARRSVHSGDEVEVLDGAVVDMAVRLQHVYVHLEEEIVQRTKELRRQYLLDRAILQGIEQGVVTTDRSGEVMEVNPAACSLLGFSQEDFLGHSAVDLLRLHIGHTPTHVQYHPVLFCLKKRKAFSPPSGARLNLIQKNGTLLPVVLSATPLIQDSRLHGVIVVFHDVSEERKLDYMKSEFVSLASHQLRTPLSTFRWYLELLLSERGKMSRQQQEYLGEMEHATSRMISLLNALLHAARLEGEKMTLDVKRVNASVLLRELGEEWRHLASDTKILLSLSVPSKAVWVRTDPTLLRIVLQNLMGNAVKYSLSGGHVEVTLREGAMMVSVTVKDTGVGIPEREQRRIFQKFFRAANIRKMDTDGSGLGLYISHSIMKSLGGRIIFHSVEGKGSIFTVEIPKSSPSNRKGA